MPNAKNRLVRSVGFFSLTLLSVFGYPHFVLANDSGEKADFCSDKKPHLVEFVVSAYLMPPKGTKIDDVGDLVGKLDANAKLLRDQLPMAMLGVRSPTSCLYQGNNGKVCTYPESAHGVNDFLRQQQLLALNNQSSNSPSFHFISYSSPFRVVLCLSNTCKDSVEPASKRDVPEAADLGRFLDYNRHQTRIEGSDFAFIPAKATAVAMQIGLETDAYLGDYVAREYFVASDAKKKSNGGGTTDLGILAALIQKYGKTSERTEGSWKIYSTSIDFSALCQHMRPEAEKYVQ